MDTLFYGPMYMGASLVDFIKGSNSTRRAVQDNQESFHQEMMMQQQVSNPTAYQIGRIGGGIVAGAAMGSAAAGSAGAFVGGTTGGANGGVLAFAGGVTAAEGGVIGGIFGAAAAIPGSPGKGDGGADHSNGKYEDASYHNKNQGNSTKNKAPKDGQKALDDSLPLNENTTDRRIGISNDEIVILDKTSDGLYHGHVREWSELTEKMKSVLRKAGLVDKKGNIIK